MKITFRSSQIASTLAIWMVSLASFFCVLAFSVFLQWLIYDDWMHRTGPIQIVGSLLAAALAFLVVMRWQTAIRRRKEEMLRQFESIKWMNDRIRNSLQAIDLLAFVDSQTTGHVRSAVDAIESVLREVLEETHHELGSGAPREEMPARSLDLPLK